MKTIEQNKVENSSFTRLTPIFRIISIVFALILISVIFQTYKIYSIRHNWISTRGIVTKTSTKGWWNAEKQRRYYLSYQYKIAGKLFTSSQFHIQEDSLTRSKHLYSSLKKGDRIQVYVNPANHEQAVINADYLRNGALFFIVISGFLVMAQTMITKESIWEKHTTTMLAKLGTGYKGDMPLPNSAIIEDTGNILKINTGMSAFWNFGIPFLALSFICMAVLMFFTEEINPGWELFDYLTVVGAGLAFCLAGAMIISKIFSYQLQFDCDNQQILDISRFMFWKKTKRYSFSEVEELRLYREKWRHDNPLHNWMLFIQTKSRRSIFISHRHRDLQPASKDYLSFLQKRIEYILNRPN